MDILLAWHSWGVPIFVLAAAVFIGALVKKDVGDRLGAWIKKTETPFDDLLLNSFGRHVVFWFGLGGLSLAVAIAPLGELAKSFLYKAAGSLFLLSLTWALAQFSRDAIGIYARRLQAPKSVSHLLSQLARLGVLALGLAMVFSNLGVSIAPLLTALGVGSLAVALALQDTLTNFFAGIHMVASRQVEVGDYLQLEDGKEGYVEEIGWRATSVRQLADNMILIPNSKLSQSTIINYYKPGRELGITVAVGVSYDSDLAHVEEVTVDVAREVQQNVPGAATGFEPFIRYHSFGDSAINMSVILRAREFADRYLLSHEFHKRLHARYRREGIEIPFPQRTLHLKGGDPGLNRAGT